MRTTLTTTAVIALLAGAASAEGISFAKLSYDYQSIDSDDFGEPTVTLLQGQVEYEMDQYLLGADLDIISVDADAGDEDTQDFTVFGAYRINPQVLAGVGLGQSDRGSDNVTIYEVFGQYVAAPFAVAANYAFDDDDETLTSLFGEYAFGPQLKVGASVFIDSASDSTAYHLSSDYTQGAVTGRAFFVDDGISDDNVVGLRGRYDFGNAFNAGASYETSFGGDFSETAIRIGGGYAFEQGIEIHASYGQIDREAQSTDDVFRLLVTYETGNQARFDRKMTRDIVEDTWFGVAPLFVSGLVVSPI